MGFDWHANVETGYVQEVKVLNCYSRFATRCLKLANPVPSSAAAAAPTAKKRKKAQRTPKRKLPGEELTEKEMLPDSEALQALYAREDNEDNRWEEIETEMRKNEWGYPFSETEEEVEAMCSDDRETYDKIKKIMGGNHAEEFEGGGIVNYSGEYQVNAAFQSAVEHLLPGQGCEFSIEVVLHGGAYGEADKGAKEELSYLRYTPAHTKAGGGMDVSRGGINIPWGNKLTSMHVLDEEEAKQVDAAFSVIVDALGLTPIGGPQHALITTSSGG